MPMVDKTAPQKKNLPGAAGKVPSTAAKPQGIGGKPMSAETRAKLEQITKGLDMLQEDTSVPRNIRRGAEDAKKTLWDETSALDVRKSKAITLLDELANDPNIPVYGRTLIWSIMSQLEPIA